MSEEMTLDDFSDEAEESVGGDKSGNTSSFSMIPQDWSLLTIDDIIADEENAFTDGARYSLSSAEIYNEGDARAILLEEVGEGKFKDTNPKFATKKNMKI